MSDLADRVARVTAETFEIVDYDPAWPRHFEQEKARLLDTFPVGSIRRIEHIGSTAVPGLAAKPVVDVLVGVDDLALVREVVAPSLEARGYDYFWRPTFGDSEGPFYAWFIRRDATGRRTHHIHVVEMIGFEQHWDRVLFRDYLVAHDDVAQAYGRLKRELVAEFGADRVRYTDAKSAFIADVMRLAKQR